VKDTYTLHCRLGWEWVFFINVPVGLATGIAVLGVVPSAPAAAVGRRVDLLGALTAVAGLVVLLYAIEGANGHGWDSARTLALVLASSALLATFVAGGGALLALAPDLASYGADVLPGFVVLGFGVGLVYPAAAIAAMSDVSDEVAGLSSGLITTGHELGAAFGVAVMAIPSRRPDTAISSTR
jgi:predicted secreted protein